MTLNQIEKRMGPKPLIEGLAIGIDDCTKEAYDILLGAKTAIPKASSPAGTLHLLVSLLKMDKRDPIAVLLDKHGVSLEKVDQEAIKLLPKDKEVFPARFGEAAREVTKKAVELRDKRALISPLHLFTALMGMGGFHEIALKRIGADKDELYKEALNLLKIRSYGF